MAKYEIKLVRKNEVAAGTMSFFFTKPEGFIFKPGQNADYTIVDPPETDPEGNTRTFSFVSAPYEPEIEIATRMRDTAFKRTLASLPSGATLSFEGPFGSMTLQNDASRPAVFLAGGIGITPFVSMARHATREKLPRAIYLFYSNRTPQDAAFLRELTDLQNENHNFHLIPTMTKDDEESWDGEAGYIDGTMLARHLGDVHAPIYYLAGPPAMTLAMRSILDGLGVDSDWVKSEEFSGY